jgi:hypothetical protein
MSSLEGSKVSSIPNAPVGDLVLERDEDEAQWEQRVMQLAASRIHSARVRLERLGVVDAEGNLVARELPLDMSPESATTLETG